MPNENMPVPRVMIGSVSELRSRLLRYHAEQALVILMDDVNAAEGEALAVAVSGLLPMMKTLLRQRRESALETMVDLLLPDVPLPQGVLAEAQRTAEWRRAIIEGNEWLSAARIADLAGFSPSNPSAQPNRWKLAGKIFAISLRGADHYPAYALDPEAGYRPLPVMAEVLSLLSQRHGDAWEIARWFLSPHPGLGGGRPCDCLRERGDAVLAAALAQAA